MTVIKPFYHVNLLAGKPEIKLYGHIDTTEKGTDWKRFEEALTNLTSKKAPLTIKMNCYGGSIFEGLAMYDGIRDSESEVTGLVEGVAASMGLWLFLACDIRKMTKHSRVMIHRAKGVVGGESEAIRAYADMMDAEGERLTAILIERTGQSAEIVATWLKPGVDKWLTAKECRDMGICHEIIEGPKVSLPAAMFKHPDAEKLVDAFAAVLNTENEESDIMKNTLKAGLGTLVPTLMLLKDDAPEMDYVKEVTAALTEKDNKITELQAKLDTQMGDSIEAALDTAQAEGKFVAEQRPAWKKLLTADFGSGIAALNAMGKRVDPNAVIKGAQAGASGASATDRKDWNFTRWSKEDPNGLMKMKHENAEGFNALMKEEHGVEYTGL
jgi:ATP-dependent protease ClpP protease subunit